MKQIWVIDCSAPYEIRSILDEMMEKAERGRGINIVPFGFNYVSEEQEDLIADYIRSTSPSAVPSKVYYSYDW